MSSEKPRWQYRFDNFKRAYFLLDESINLKREKGLSQLEKEGVIQRFEYSMELAWKTMKDYLESQNVLFDVVTPRAVIKEAFSTKLITRGEDWMGALDTRNKMNHTYNFKEFETAIELIEQKYLVCISELYERLAQILMESSNG